MLKALYTTATGMKAQQTMVDTIANNIANVNTAGFKRTQATFEDLLYVTFRAPGLSKNVSGQASPIGLQIGSGARVSGTTKIYTPGTLQASNRPLDIAIEGEGFFQVRRTDGTIGYTRDGHFLINADGKLVTAAGNLLHPEITFPHGAQDLRIDAQGRVTFRPAGSNTAAEAGILQTAVFLNPSGLSAEGSNILLQTDASGGPVLGAPGAATGHGTLKQGFIENSNVEIVNELVNLIVAQRAYEVNSRAISTSDQMLSVATSIVQ